MRVLVVTPPGPVIGLEEARQHLRVDGHDEDGQIAGFIAAVTAHLDGPDGWLGRAIGLQTLEARCALPWGSGLRLPYRPVIELVSISYLDAAQSEKMADLEDVDLLGDQLAYRHSSWPWEGGSLNGEALRVRYRAGYEVVPPAIRAALLLMIGDLYRNRETTAIGTIAASIPMAASVENLLAPFRVYL